MPRGHTSSDKVHVFAHVFMNMKVLISILLPHSDSSLPTRCSAHLQAANTEHQKHSLYRSVYIYYIYQLRLFSMLCFDRNYLGLSPFSVLIARKLQPRINHALKEQASVANSVLTITVALDPTVAGFILILNLEVATAILLAPQKSTSHSLLSSCNHVFTLHRAIVVLLY